MPSAVPTPTEDRDVRSEGKASHLAVVTGVLAGSGVGEGDMDTDEQPTTKIRMSRSVREDFRILDDILSIEKGPLASKALLCLQTIKVIRRNWHEYRNPQETPRFLAFPWYRLSLTPGQRRKDTHYVSFLQLLLLSPLPLRRAVLPVNQGHLGQLLRNIKLLQKVYKGCVVFHLQSPAANAVGHSGPKVRKQLNIHLHLMWHLFNGLHTS
jgi:hypothetical protein